MSHFMGLNNVTKSGKPVSLGACIDPVFGQMRKGFIASLSMHFKAFKFLLQ